MQHTDEAVLYLIEVLRVGGVQGGYSNYGYDLYIPNAIREYVARLGQDPERGDGYTMQQTLSSFFLDAAWELARRGIIRPGIRTLREQSTDEGSAGAGFSVTPFGKKWLAEETQNIWVSTEPDRFAEMIAPLRRRFGQGFHSRSQEAVRCYGAHAYLACCTMCGAAAESILLATAIAKTEDEPKVLAAYSTAKGRVTVENMVIGQATENLKREFQGLTTLLKYWRDAAAHGRASTISDNEAYTSLALLLRYGTFVSEKWQELTIT
jgi:hypothetical protein